MEQCDFCDKETGLKEGVCILQIAKKEEMPTINCVNPELKGKREYIDISGETFSFCDLECLFGWMLNHKGVKDGED